MYFTQFSSYHHNHASCMRTVIFVRLPLRPQHLECGLAHGCRIMHFRMNGNCFVIMNLPAECPRCPSMLTYCNRIKTVGTIQSSGLVMSSGTFFRLALRKKKTKPSLQIRAWHQEERHPPGMLTRCLPAMEHTDPTLWPLTGQRPENSRTWGCYRPTVRLNMSFLFSHILIFFPRTPLGILEEM